MSHYTYLIINFFIIIFPLIFSFESRLSFYKKWKRVLLAALPVSLFFILWDMIATARGHWAFNPNYVTGIKIANLPIEEVLFFITVPYSCLFLYELINYTYAILLKKKAIKVIPLQLNSASLHLVSCIPFLASCLLFLVSILLLINGKEYSGFVLLLTLVITFLLIKSKELAKKKYWLWMGLMTILFFMTNLFITGLPVVTYGSEFITNIRMITIPIEDALYNWCLLSSYVLVYNSKMLTNLNKIK